MNIRKPMEIMPMTEITRAANSSGMLWLKRATAAVHSDNTVAHNNNEPSWAPQTAEIR